MLPLDQTFRIVKPERADIPSIEAGHRHETFSGEALSVSPFENPLRRITPGRVGDAAARREAELAVAAYFATFPAVD